MLFEENKNPFKEFCEWQKVPHRVKPMTKDEHVCPTCARQYVGNYCPQCGQSSKIGRYSFKNAFLLFIDVWGLGNRGMFRALRDLFLRPGYMIRDYLRGMQMAYFPPFKMFFLIFTLSLLVDSGLNIQGVNRIEHEEHDSYVEVSSFDDEQSSKTEKDKMVKEIISKLNSDVSESTKKQERELIKARKRLSELDKMFVSLYEDKVRGDISDRNYKQIASSYEQEQSQLEQQIAEYEENLRNAKVNNDNADTFVETIKEYAGIEELTAAILHTLIDKIIVHQAEEIDGERI